MDAVVPILYSAAGVIGVHIEDDWFDYKMEHDEKFLNRIAEAREEIRQGRFVEPEELLD